ncbi:hypothetical protein NQ317_008924 [Molorchus minor]|uniref:Uncharacterized protein n=1 Tax=Molorchus minor TaxID=1323400 RepID=A0ABQ9JS20_9CUCU|nr:hypothetical protein NQ317_008924 [Molorchus minor]
MRDHSGAPDMRIWPAVAVKSVHSVGFALVSGIEVIRRKRLFAIFYFSRPRQGTRGFLTAPKFIVGPFRSSGCANLTGNERTNLAISISRLAVDKLIYLTLINVRMLPVTRAAQIPSRSRCRLITSLIYVVELP